MRFEENTPIKLILTKKQGQNLIEIFEYMQQGVFDNQWYEEEETADICCQIIKRQIKAYDDDIQARVEAITGGNK